MFTPADLLNRYLPHLPAPIRLAVSTCRTDGERLAVARRLLAADPTNYPVGEERVRLDRTARRLTGCDGYAALVAALLAGERVPVCRQRTTQDEADARDLRYTLLANLLLALGD